MEHGVLKDDLGHVAVGIVLRDVNLEPEEDGGELLSAGERAAPEDSLLVGSLPDEEDAEPGEGGLGRGQAVDARQLLLQQQVELRHEAVLKEVGAVAVRALEYGQSGKRGRTDQFS